MGGTTAGRVIKKRDRIFDDNLVNFKLSAKIGIKLLMHKSSRIFG